MHLGISVMSKEEIVLHLLTWLSSVRPGDWYAYVSHPNHTYNRTHTGSGMGPQWSVKLSYSLQERTVHLLATAQSRMDQVLHDFLMEVEESIIRISQQSHETRREHVEGMLVQAELLLRDVVIVEGLLQPDHGEMLVQAVVDVVRAVRHLVDDCHRQHIRGRLQIEITEEQLASLLELHFSNHDIANLLQVSPRTIRRRIIQYGLQEDACFTEISNTDLDTITGQFCRQPPKFR